ncbi:hypothetical protein B0H17DRAFT_1034169 [Mycena rosella]|uniref:Secreted protein n=1 Tax=Mycena rosella TaxID=1033263 RepID=A0AAD7GWD1_MYCRO|nr:hypothetical protein B0H17DRAFT_1034169 [Mycena rosella]
MRIFSCPPSSTRVCFSFRLLLFRLDPLLLAALLSDAVRPGSCSLYGAPSPCVIASESGTSNATPSRNGDPRDAFAVGASTTAEPSAEREGKGKDGHAHGHPIPRVRHPQRHYKGDAHKLMGNPTMSIDLPSTIRCMRGRLADGDCEDGKATPRPRAAQSTRR